MIHVINTLARYTWLVYAAAAASSKTAAPLMCRDRVGVTQDNARTAGTEMLISASIQIILSSSI